MVKNYLPASWWLGYPRSNQDPIVVLINVRGAYAGYSIQVSRRTLYLYREWCRTYLVVRGILLKTYHTE